jgi:hypothetical protein
MRKLFPWGATIVMLLPALLSIAEDIRVADERLFARLDSNADGQLVSDDLPAGQARLFARLVRLGDADNDGGLSKEEWQHAITPPRPVKPIEEKRPSDLPGADAARLILLKLDVDGDGVLMQDEAPRAMRQVFTQLVNRFDRNDDDRVNRIELARGGPRLTRMAQQAVRRLNLDVERELKRLDREQGDAAQRFSEQPWARQRIADPKRAIALFEEFDINSDGKIEREEVPDRLGRLYRFGDRNRDGNLSEEEFMAARQQVNKLQRRKASEEN